MSTQENFERFSAAIHDVKTTLIGILCDEAPAIWDDIIATDTLKSTGGIEQHILDVVLAKLFKSAEGSVPLNSKIPDAALTSVTTPMTDDEVVAALKLLDRSLQLD